MTFGGIILPRPVAVGVPATGKTERQFHLRTTWWASPGHRGQAGLFKIMFERLGDSPGKVIAGVSARGRYRAAGAPFIARNTGLNMAREPATTDFAARSAELADLGYVLSLLYWDQRTQMPAGGLAARGFQIATVESLLHERTIDPEYGKLLQRRSRPTAVVTVMSRPSSGSRSAAPPGDVSPRRFRGRIGPGGIRSGRSLVSGAHRI